jgi:hypothetical protein
VVASVHRGVRNDIARICDFKSVPRPMAGAAIRHLYRQLDQVKVRELPATGDRPLPRDSASDHSLARTRRGLELVPSRQALCGLEAFAARPASRPHRSLAEPRRTRLATGTRDARLATLGEHRRTPARSRASGASAAPRGADRLDGTRSFWTCAGARRSDCLHDCRTPGAFRVAFDHYHSLADGTWHERRPLHAE